MLLIDRILAAAHQTRRRREFTEYEKAMWGMLHLAVPHIYDITSVAPLFPDWERERDHPVPRRAPAEILWCEWEDNDPCSDRPELGPIPMRLGSLIAESGMNGALVAVGRQKFPQVDELFKENGIGPDDLVYVLQNFQVLNGRVPHYPPQAVGVPVESGFWAFFAFRPTGEQIHAFAMPSRPQDGGDEFAFGIPSAGNAIRGMFRHRINELTFNRWYPFMAFSLLHCKNVVTTTHGHTEDEQRRVRKSGNPPRVTFKTIELKVPETLGPRQSSDPNPDAKDSVRFHLCRGHFKNLTHPRYKTPGLHWWPAHWRGNPDQGVVITDRAVVPADPTASDLTPAGSRPGG